MSFETALEHVLKMEGGIVDHPLDRGGFTNFGVTKAALSFYYGREATDDDIRSLTRDDVEVIYFYLYWRPLKLSQFKSDLLALIVFDQAVNRGKKAATVSLQRALGGLKIDGVLGPKTLAAVNQADERKAAIKLLIECQKAYIAIVKKRPSQIVFLVGWLSRTWNLFSFL